MESLLPPPVPRLELPQGHLMNVRSGVLSEVQLSSLKEMCQWLRIADCRHVFSRTQLWYLMQSVKHLIEYNWVQHRAIDLSTETAIMMVIQALVSQQCVQTFSSPEVTIIQALILNFMSESEYAQVMRRELIGYIRLIGRFPHLCKNHF